MAYSYRFLERAITDLSELDTYFDSDAPQKGAKFYVKLDSSIARACEMPEMFPVYDRFPVYRRIVVLDWLVFYIVDNENQRIDIHKVIDSRMKMPDRLLD